MKLTQLTCIKNEYKFNGEHINVSMYTIFNKQIIEIQLLFWYFNFTFNFTLCLTSLDFYITPIIHCLTLPLLNII